MNGTTIPTGRDNTYSSDKVNRSYSIPRTPLVVHVNLITGVLDKTWRQINDAFPNVYLETALPVGENLSGQKGLKSSNDAVSSTSAFEKYLITGVSSRPSMYFVVAVMSDFVAFISGTPDGYPVSGSAITDDTIAV